MASVHNVTATQQDAISSGQQRKQTATTQNVGQAERWVSAIGGGALLVYGIARLDWLGAGIGLFGSGLLYRGVTGHSFTYQAVNFNTAQQRSPTVTEIPDKKGFRVQRALTINRLPEELYEFWSDVEKTPMYTPGISSVTKTGGRTSHWVAQGPFGRSVEWNGELLEDLPAKGIAWHVHGKPTTANAGRVHFEADPGRRGPDACIDAVGLEAHGTSLDSVYDMTRQKARMTTDRPHVLRQAIQACRKGGTVSIPGVYGGLLDKMPFGAAFAKGLTFKMGQTHVHRYLQPLLERIQKGEIDPSFVITHRLKLDEAPYAYDIFKHKEDGCIKVILKP
jgi:uncharacterized membrane protein